jgi:hypothetical protein
MRLILLAVPCFLLSLLPALFITGAVAGFLWLFVYGDNPWPDLADIVIASAFLLSWVSAGTLLTLGLIRHPRVRNLPTSKLTVAAALLSLFAVATIAYHQWSIGNLDPSNPCLIQCREAGHPAGMTAIDEQGHETCTCLD